MIKRQLFRLVRDVDTAIHTSLNLFTNEYRLLEERHAAGFIVCWPDRSPCLHVEWFLAEITPYVSVRRSDGSTLKVMASDLSHLVRFCWSKQVGFEDLTDVEFYAFIESLVYEGFGRSVFLARNRNTARRIVQHSTIFLQWLQENVVLNRTIIGPREQSPQISAKIVNNAKGASYVSCRLEHPRLPRKDPPGLKTPIAGPIITRLWDAVGTVCLPDAFSPRYKARFRSDAEFVAEIEYLRSRRELLLTLLESTGCRPGELALMDVRNNANCSTKSQLVLTTLKRRTNRRVTRLIPVDLGTAIAVESFISGARKQLLLRLKQRGVIPQPQGSVFLCARKGTPLPEGSMAREFSRLVATAGISQRTCMSMFRHRFITNMVALHLRAFSRDHQEKQRALFTESDYLSILKKVAQITGHAKETSLLSYIDLAWGALGLFEASEAELRLIQNTENSIRRIQSLTNYARMRRGSDVGKLGTEIISELESLKARATRVLRDHGNQDK